MCASCGCGAATEDPTRHAHPHSHPPHAAHAAHAAHADARRIAVEQAILADNDARARVLAAGLAARGIRALGLVGGPGAGKTALLEATFARLGPAARAEAVIEGDCATDFDARRIAARGVRVAQVTTGSLCHLDAHLIEHALEKLDLSDVTRLWIENVGNLVCPAAFACGEARRAVLVSVAEGDDKPEKYPAMLASADLLVISKSDLLPHVDFDVERCVRSARRVRPHLPWLCLSARTGEGLEAWLRWADGGSA